MVISMHWGFRVWIRVQAFNFTEPPWYGPVCPVVWEGGSREAPLYPDLPVILRLTA
jgi:hypothetical protein